MDTAQEIVTVLEGQGLSLKDMHELSGVGLSTLYAIKNGDRTGKTSIPALRRLLDTTRQHMIPLALPEVVEGSITHLDEPPVQAIKRQRVQTAPSTAIQTYYAAPTPTIDTRGQAYRQQRGRESLADTLVQEVQALRYEVHQLRQEQAQVQRQRVHQAKERNYEAGYSLMNLIAEAANTLTTFYLETQEKKRETQQEYTPLPPQRSQRPLLPEPVRYTPPAQPQPYRAYRHSGVYGKNPNQAIQKETPPTIRQRVRKLFGF